jgi:hypothetical protein
MTAPTRRSRGLVARPHQPQDVWDVLRRVLRDTGRIWKLPADGEPTIYAASCGAGELAVSGGFMAPPDEVAVFARFMTMSDRWDVGAKNGTSELQTLTVIVYCLPT